MTTKWDTMEATLERLGRENARLRDELDSAYKLIEYMQAEIASWQTRLIQMGGSDASGIHTP